MSILRHLILSFACAFLLLANLAAADAKKKNPIAMTVPASLRLWKSDFPSKRTIRIIVRHSARATTPTMLGDYPPVSRFGDYIFLPSGACTIELSDVQNAKTVEATLATQLAPDSACTLVVREVAGTATLELLDDTPTASSTAEFVVRNFITGLQTLQIDAGPDLHVRLNTDDSFLHLRGLSRTPLEIETSGTDASGTPVHWTNDVDFSKIRRATLLIVTDPYGRIRPRVVVDGQNQEPKKE